VPLTTDWISIAISALIAGLAYLFAAMNWLEARRLRQLLETFTKSLPYVTRRPRPRKKGSPVQLPGITPYRSPDPVKMAIEERRRLKLELEREKLQWQKNKDFAKAIGWIIDRLDSGDEDDEE
jgi:hypothetical protein